MSYRSEYASCSELACVQLGNRRRMYAGYSELKQSSYQDISISHDYHMITKRL